MATWYRLNKWRCEIDPVEVESSTAYFVSVYDPFWKQYRRVAKAGECFPTFSEARSELLRILNLKVDNLKKDLDVTTEHLREERS